LNKSFFFKVKESDFFLLREQEVGNCALVLIFFFVFWLPFGAYVALSVMQVLGPSRVSFFSESAVNLEGVITSFFLIVDVERFVTVFFWLTAFSLMSLVTIFLKLFFVHTLSNEYL